MCIPHLKIFRIENGKPKYCISACFEAKVAPCVFAITANNLLVVCDKSSCAKTSRGILHLRIALEKRNFKIDRIKSYTIEDWIYATFLAVE
jgi:hypothetical protein